MLVIRSFKITYFFQILLQVSVAPHSFNVAMGSVSPPLLDALDLGLALMEVMRGTAVSFSPILTVINSCSIIVISEYNILVTICTVSCQSTAFQCSNGTCIFFSRRCDGTVDCIDDSDETGCGSKLSNREIEG